jgi:hypothetical protein
VHFDAEKWGHLYIYEISIFLSTFVPASSLDHNHKEPAPLQFMYRKKKT